LEVLRGWRERLRENTHLTVRGRHEARFPMGEVGRPKIGLASGPCTRHCVKWTFAREGLAHADNWGPSAIARKRRASNEFKSLDRRHQRNAQLLTAREHLWALALRELHKRRRAACARRFGAAAMVAAVRKRAATLTVGDRVRVAKYDGKGHSITAKIVAVCEHGDANASKTWAVVAIPGRGSRCEARDAIELEAA
jgi:hypothetical protein